MKSNILQIRLTDDEKSRITKAAEGAGMSISAWVRDRLSSAALREAAPSVYPLGLERPLGTAYAAEEPPFWERMVRLGQSIPEPEWEKLPGDLAVNLDKYLDSSDW